MSGTTRRPRRGPAGLLVALFVVGGLVFSYGLRHAPPERMCTQHAVSVPVAAASAFAGHQGPSPLHALHSAADTALTAPGPSHAPLDVCLCLAVLFTLALLGLAAVLRRPAARLPARMGWTLRPPSAGASRRAPRPALQVLRL